MSKNKIIKENLGADANTVTTVTPVNAYSSTEFEKCIKDFFKGYKIADLKRIENLGGSTHEQFDIDIKIPLDKGIEDDHAQEKRQNAQALVHQMKQDFYNHLHTKGYNVSTMSVRGVRTNGNDAETTVSLTLSNAPKVHREHVIRVRNLIESVIKEVIAKPKKK